MQEMVSKITTIPFNNRKEVVAAANKSQRETTSHIAPSISVEGVPGEYDFRKFLTPAFEGLRPVKNSSGGAVVNSIAVTTNKESWKSEEPAFINGLFGPVKKVEGTARWYTDLSGVAEGDPVPPVTTFDDGYPPSKAVVTGQTTAKGFSNKLTQASDKR